MNKVVKNIPNIITSSRIVASILGCAAMISGNFPLAIGLYAYGAISDMFDGMLARKLKATSEFGRKLDPVSDKIFALSLIIPSLVLGNLFMIVTLAMEGAISAINLVNKDAKTSRLGKYKTVSLFPTMILGLVATQIPILYAAFIPFWIGTFALQKMAVKDYYEQARNAIGSRRIAKEKERDTMWEARRKGYDSKKENLLEEPKTSSCDQTKRVENSALTKKEERNIKNTVKRQQKIIKLEKLREELTKQLTDFDDQIIKIDEEEKKIRTLKKK